MNGYETLDDEFMLDLAGRVSALADKSPISYEFLLFLTDFVNVAVDKPTIPLVKAFIKEFYQIPGNSLGGSLHMVFEDGNIKRSDVQFCKEAALEKQDWVGASIADILLRMSVTQRKKLSRMSYYA